MKFSNLEKIDSHMYYNTVGVALLRQADNDKFSLISINTDLPFFDSISKQQEYILDLCSIRLDYIATFEMVNWGGREWINTVLEQIKFGIKKKGAVAINISMNTGMNIRDENDNFVKLDHPSFQPIFEYLTANKIPVFGHLGGPKNCWLSFIEKIENSNNIYLNSDPEYYPINSLSEKPSCKEQVKARDNVLRSNPNLIFIGAGLEWDIDVLGAWLDKFPNTAVDLAGRIYYLQLQTIENWKKVRDFMIKYQDRILYGSNIIYNSLCNPIEIKERTHKVWKSDWKFFTTNNKMKVDQFDDKYKGLALPDNIVVKIYRENALKWYPKIKNMMNQRFLPSI